MTALALLLPPAPPGSGGGNRHDRALLSALGPDARPVEASDAASLRAALAALPAGTTTVLDGLLLRHAGGLVPELERRDAAALVHHLAALTDEPDRQAVRETERAVLGRLRRVVATSEPVARRLCEEYGLAPDRVRCVPPGMAVLPRAAGSGGPGCAVLSVGRLAPRKGHTALLRALARLSDLDWHLTIMGDGFEEPGHEAGLRALAAELGVAERLRIEPLPDPALRERLWHGADVFALASERETTGAAVAEALRRGLPVAVTAAGHLVPAAAGCVCTPGDAATLSKSLRRMIFDTALRADMAEAAWAAGRALPGWDAQAAALLAALA